MEGWKGDGMVFLVTHLLLSGPCSAKAAQGCLSNRRSGHLHLPKRAGEGKEGYGTVQCAGPQTHPRTISMMIPGPSMLVCNA